MTSKLKPHQQAIVSEDRKWAGIFLEPGGGKTLLALTLAQGKILVICPKQQRDDRTWQKENEKFGLEKDLTVISKEDLKKMYKELPQYDTVIADEFHTMCGATTQTYQRNYQQFIKTSQIFECLLWYLKNKRPERFYACTGTPARFPMNVWAIGTLFGKVWDGIKFRNTFYVQGGIGYKNLWFARKDNATKERLANLIKATGYTGKISDWVKVPEQVHMVRYITPSLEIEQRCKEIWASEPEPMLRNGKLRQVQNGIEYVQQVMSTSEGDRMFKITNFYKDNKINEIIRLYKEHKKLLVFVNYTAQIERYAEVATKEHIPHRTLTGATKDRAEVIEFAQKMSEGILFAQSSLSSGYNLQNIDVVVFASKSYKYTDYEQALARVQRIDNVKKNTYVHLLIKGSADEACHKAILEGEDFQERVMRQDI
jgi:hypothetical protein